MWLPKLQPRRAGPIRMPRDGGVRSFPLWIHWPQLFLLASILGSHPLTLKAQTLYAYYRDEYYDSDGRLTRVSAETQVTVSITEPC